MTASPRSAIVVGAGIIGQASAFAIARRDVDVTVLDPHPGGGATHAAAGMLAPSAEVAPGEQDNYSLQLQALPSWRELNDALFEVSGERVDIVESGTLVVGWDSSDRRQVAQYVQVALQFGVSVVPVSRATHPDYFEGITGRIVEGYYVAGDAWLDPDVAMRLLSDANHRLGVSYVDEAVEEVVTGSDYVEARSSTRHRARAGILATGVGALPRGAHAPATYSVRPIRGITVRLSGFDRGDQPTIRAFVRGRLFYMVSRPGGYCVVGATSEERSELRVEVGETQRLLRDALDIVPAVESSNLIETRVGLRPASADLRPFFAVLEGGRWAWSSGHYRHGVTLAALAGRDAARFVEGSL